MKHFLVSMFGAATVLTAGLLLVAAQDQGSKDDPIPGKFFTGAKPTPHTKIIEALKSGRAGVYRATEPPPQVVTVPKRLSVWGNDRYGICVTSESCFAVSDYSTHIGMDPQLFIPEDVCIKWARDRGYLNGANLLEVIEDMQKDGIKDEKGTLRKAGKASSVDYRNESTLKSAIAQGPVSIAIASSSLPNGAGSKNGWYIFSGGSSHATDHCVGLHGYGPTSELFKALNTPVPSGAPAQGYLLFTWGTVGVVTHQWLMGTCVEAWVRNPTTTDLQPPTPPVTELVVTVANVFGQPDVPVKFSPSAKGGTSPYIFLFDYGDGAQDAAGSHVYKAVGSYKAIVTAVDSTGKIGTATCTATIGSTPPPPPGPGGGTITWIDGTVWEVFPLGTRQKLRELTEPMNHK